MLRDFSWTRFALGRPVGNLRISFLAGNASASVHRAGNSYVAVVLNASFTGKSIRYVRAADWLPFTVTRKILRNRDSAFRCLSRSLFVPPTSIDICAPRRMKNRRLPCRFSAFNRENSCKFRAEGLFQAVIVHQSLYVTTERYPKMVSFIFDFSQLW